MKREEKNALSKQRILDAALREFSAKGYEAASLNTVCMQNDISKGIIYHYFKDKDALYLLCVADCFEKLTAHLEDRVIGAAGGAEGRLKAYFDARLRFFAENPVYLGVFLSAVLTPPAHLTAALANARAQFDAHNAAALTDLLQSAPLREGLSISTVVEDFRMYMDYFNARLRAALLKADTPEQAFREHETCCHRQLNILLYGVMERQNEQN